MLNKNIHFFLCLLLVLFGYLTYKDIIFVGFSEYGILEALQVLVLLVCLFLNIKSKGLYKKYSNSLLFYLRNLFFGFIIYEELSFLTRPLKDVPINRYGEWNFHNSNIFYHKVFENIPILKDFPLTDDVTGYILFNLVVLLILGYGYYLNPFSKKLNILFLSRKFSIYSQIYFFDLFFSHLFRYAFPGIRWLIDMEYIELFIYIVLLFDIIEKNRNLLNLTASRKNF